MIELFFQYFSAIDVHDHMRGSLVMEHEWYTHSWWHRMFGTILGICIVEAYLGYRYESEQAFFDAGKMLMTLLILLTNLVIS